MRPIPPTVMTKTKKTDFENYFAAAISRVETALRGLLPRRFPRELCDAMRYSVFSDGKRVRPALVLAGAGLSGLKPADVLDAACAVELIHTYSLIHDDLPALDNDDFRRGKPTSHKKFGEDIAILAGDALLTYAFELAARNAARLDGASPEAVAELARAVGKDGMVGGQAADVKHGCRRESGRRAARYLNYIHTNKTARLIEISSKLGALLAGAPASKVAALSRYGLCAGLAFQIADDILDEGEENSDFKNGRLTYTGVYGTPAARLRARRLVAEAKRALSVFKPSRDKKFMEDLADFIVDRKK